MKKISKERLRKKFIKMVDSFDFDGIAKCYIALNWVWSTGKIPEANEIRSLTLSLINMLLDDLDIKNYSSGGISVGLEDILDCNDEPFIRFEYDIYGFEV
jgi:hypothetical protein